MENLWIVTIAIEAIALFMSIGGLLIYIGSLKQRVANLEEDRKEDRQRLNSHSDQNKQMVKEIHSVSVGLTEVATKMDILLMQNGVDASKLAKE